MRAAVLLLVLANLVLFAWQHGYLGEWTPAGREPARLAQQIEPQAIRVLSETELRQLRKSAAPTATGDRVAASDCMELGDFAPEVAARVRAQLDAAALGDKLSVVEVGPTIWYMVYLPPLKSLADARRLADDLRKKGLRDLAIIQDSSSLQNGISLGQFRDLALAQRQQADIEQRGFGNVRIAARPAGEVNLRYRITAPEAATRERLAQLQAEFGGQLSACAP